MKKHLPLIIALAVPLVFIGFIIASVYIPQVRLQPQYDFLYTLPENSYYSWNKSYDVVDGKIQKVELADNAALLQDLGKDKEEAYPEIYRYDVKTDTSTEISFEDAQALTLSGKPDAPDGFAVRSGGYNGDILSGLFGGYRNDYNKVYIEKNGASKSLNITMPSSYPYYSDHNFVGWVLQ